MKNSKPDPTEIGNRLYCPGCDSFRPPDLFRTGKGRIEIKCKDCTSKRVLKHYKAQHDKAIEALGNTCMECDTKYDREKGVLMYMMRLPGYPYGDSQYARDKAIIDDPETAKKYIWMVCKKHRPVFESITDTLIPQESQDTIGGR